MQITPERASAAVTAFAIIMLLAILIFNVGRASALAQARQCPPPTGFTVPVKGTLP